MEFGNTLVQITKRELVHALGAGILVLGIAVPANAITESATTSKLPVPEHQAFLPEEDDILKTLSDSELL